MNPEDFLGLSRRDLRALFEDGHSIDPVDLHGSVYRGISLGLPRWMVKLTWLKFMKAFQVDPKDGRLKGYNIRTIDDDLDAPWQPKMKKGRPIIFGHFDVINPESSGPFSHGLLLDYSRSGRGGNGLLNALRDPLVALESGSAKRLLGLSYVKLLGQSIMTPSYFLLERRSRIDDVCAEPESVYK